MRVARGERDLLDRIEVQVDPSTEPTDWDDALAKFLLAFVRKQATSAAGTAAAEPVDVKSTAADIGEEQCSSK